MGSAAPAIGAAALITLNGITSVGAAANVAKVMGIGFRKGGATGTAPQGEAVGLPGLRVG